MSSKIIIIAGGGKFGKKAINFALKNDYIGIVIDSNPNCAAVAEYSDLTTLSIDYLMSNLSSLKKNYIYFLNQDVAILKNLLDKIKPEYVIPVIPVHLLAKIIEIFLSKKSIKLIPNKITLSNFLKISDSNLILDNNPSQGIVYLSYARGEEICPDMCPCPPKYCPNFKREKPVTITEYIENLFNINNLINVEQNDILEIFVLLNSYQLTAGLGGLKGEEIYYILENLKLNIEPLRKKKLSLTIATTCNCHGVINFYKNKN